MTDGKEPNGFRTFLILWATQSISVFGSNLTFFAVTIWITTVLFPNPEQRPQLALALSGVGLSFTIPSLVLAPFAGAAADRYDRRKIMMVTDLASSVLSLTLMSLVLGGALRFWMLSMLLVLFAVVGQFHGSAFDTSYATLVPRAQLPRANGMMQTMWALSGVLSPAIAATIIAIPGLARQGAWGGAIGTALAKMTNGAPLAMAIDVLTFWVAAMALAFLSIPSPKRTDLGGADGKARKSIWADVREGALFIWYRRPLLWLLGTFALVNFLNGFLNVLAPLLLKFRLAPDWSGRGFTFESALALYTSVFSVGGVLGGVFISAWGGLKRRRVLGVLVPLFVQGAVFAVLGLSVYLYLTAAMGFLLGFFNPITNAHSQSIWQMQTPSEKQGRVFAVRRVIAQFTLPVATVLAGVVGGFFEPSAVIAGAGLVWVVFLGLQLANPYLRRVEDKEWLEGLASAAEAKALAAGSGRTAGSGPGVGSAPGTGSKSKVTHS